MDVWDAMTLLAQYMNKHLVLYTSQQIIYCVKCMQIDQFPTENFVRSLGFKHIGRPSYCCLILLFIFFSFWWHWFSGPLQAVYLADYMPCGVSQDRIPDNCIFEAFAFAGDHKSKIRSHIATIYSSPFHFHEESHNQNRRVHNFHTHQNWFIRNRRARARIFSVCLGPRFVIWK